MNYQDIHLEDKALWNQLQTAWEQGDYTAALNVLKNASLSDKQLNAAAINALTTELLRLQNQKDIGFKQDKIVVSAEPPADLADGQVYFKLIGPATEFDDDSYYIQITQKSNGSYTDLNPETRAVDTMLTPSVSQDLFSRNISLDEAISIVTGVLVSQKAITVTVKDEAGNPIEGAIINGLERNPSTNSNGIAAGRLSSYNLNVISPYIDLQNKTVVVSTTTARNIDIVLEKYSDNKILRFEQSKSVKFSSNIKNIDVCCVGGGGGGANYILYSSGANSFRTATNPGGGGGGIVNSIGVTVQPNTSYQILVGQGGTTKGAGSTNGSGNTGGTSSFAGVSAAGGGGGIAERTYISGQYGRKMEAGTAGVAGCGDGGSAQGNGSDATPGSANTTISEFNDGSTFYSGGGGAGTTDFNSVKAGGAPNGASGAYWYNSAINASSAGIGGGGGGGMIHYNNGSYYTGYASAGGPGLVAIRLHYN